MKHILILFLSLALLSCTSTNPNSKKETLPQNIIFLIGDGMGVSAVSTSFYYGEQPSVFEEFNHIGLQKTSSATHVVTGSAASGTAMATGYKTYNGAIGVDTSKTEVENIAELLAKHGWSTGVVATSTISHATPAVFYAHVNLRKNEEAIAEQLLDSPIDFFAGGGRDRFNKRKDSVNLLTVAEEKDFVIDSVLAEPGSLDPGKKYGFLVDQGSVVPAHKGNASFLPDASTLAIEHLSQNDKGFFVMIEGSQIDWAAHGNDFEYLLGEMKSFEASIRLAMDFAKADGNTLVVVTADHETGGFALPPGAKGEYNETYTDYNYLVPAFASGHHTASLVPVFAYGPGAECFQGIYENTEIFKKMAKLTAGNEL